MRERSPEEWRAIHRALVALKESGFWDDKLRHAMQVLINQVTESEDIDRTRDAILAYKHNVLFVQSLETDITTIGDSNE